MKKLLVVFTLLICMMIFVTACTPNEAVPEEKGNGVEEPVAVTPSVALVLSGSINDMDWNAGGYEGIMQIEDEYGAKVSYAENVAQSDFKEVLRNYAEVGFDLVFGHSGQMMDAILAVSDDYPDTQFICINGTATRDNVTNIEIAEDEAGYLMGATAALLSESGSVGVIGSVDIKPVRRSVDGFALGAKYINPDINVLSTMTGSWSDAVIAKEIAISMIDNKADVIGNLAGIAGISIIEAAKESDVYAIGAGKDQHTTSPETVPVSVIKDLARLFTFIYEKEIDGNLEQTNYFVGTKEGAVYPIYPGDQVSQETKDTLAEISDAISRGEIKTR